MWGEPGGCFLFWGKFDISTHSPRVGRTYSPRSFLLPPVNFNSLAPCGANRMEVDETGLFFDFNSLAPCGANHGLWLFAILALIFQLTRPVWGEPRLEIDDIGLFFISTHSPRVGRTKSARQTRCFRAYFNSLAPCGANLDEVTDRTGYYNFNSLAPCGANPASSAATFARQ